MTRYEDTERTFAALPPAQGRGFARTWWGRAWLRALEDAAMDASQVKTGRRLARAGAVGAVSVRPGRITSVVQDRDGTAHRADVLLERLSDAQWDHFVDMAIERSGPLGGRGGPARAPPPAGGSPPPRPAPPPRRGGPG
ncbi:hypothetical protein ACFWIR_29295, partial [Streptomyces olivaceus]